MLSFCIPTLLKYDLCIKLIQSVELNTVKSDKFYILDNGGGFKEYTNNKILLDKIEIINFGRNLGVASSWNWFLSNIEGDLIIANDDIVLKENVIEAFVKAKQNEVDKNVVMYSTANGSYKIFMVNNSIIKKVGLFDENFWPAYFEDSDMMYRMKLGGYINKEVIKEHDPCIHHEESATLKAQRLLGLNKEHDNNFNKNKNYYINKWGGEPHYEVYKIPFNKEN
jgi:GT2 family glycosyltransferase